MPPVGAMGLSGMHFLATIAVAVAIWILDVFEKYIVGLMLLLLAGLSWALSFLK